MEKIVDIIDSIAHEKGLNPDKVKDVIKTALVKTAKQVIDEDYEFEAEIDEASKTAKMFQIITVVEDSDERVNILQDAVISLSEAKELDDEVEIGDELRYEHDLLNLGRTAVATLHREIEYHIQRLIEEELYSKFISQVGSIVSGDVVRVDQHQNTYIEIDELRAVLPMKNRIKGEKFKVGNVVKAILKRVNINKKDGIYIELSRTTPKFLEELLRIEVPEIADEIVTINKSARIPGERAKVALTSTNPKVDPVGATVGVKGVRINAVSNELKNENIDCVEFTAINEMFISRALAPAIVSAVQIVDDNKARVTLPSDQKSKAIGKNGINIRLASMLTGFEIELVEKQMAFLKNDEKDDEGKEEGKLLGGLDSLEALFKK